ncbi:phosphatidylserine decarboxylase [Clostridium botulinum A1 str. CFSAN002368]|nr:phosphatidylserine decarboxylase [Clostridium botulinum A1 str. CFSAN002368]
MIKYYNRRNKDYDIEKSCWRKIFKLDLFLTYWYESFRSIYKKEIFSKIYGFYCNKRLSRKK